MCKCYNTKSKKNTKLKKLNGAFFTKSQKNRNENIWILCNNVWTNYNYNLLSISNWPSEPQFCERWIYIWQKSGQKQLYISHIRVTFVSDHSLHTYIWKYLYGFVSRRCHLIHGSDSSIVRYENEGLCGYVLLNSDFIFLATHTTKIRFHVWICRCPAHSSRQKYLEPHF